MLHQAASISLISRRVPRVMSCVSNTPGIAQKLNITIKKVMKETSELGKQRSEELPSVPLRPDRAGAALRPQPRPPPHPPPVHRVNLKPAQLIQ